MNRKMFWLEILLIAATCVATAVAYPDLPTWIPIHWNIHLRPNGYGPKWTLFLFGPGLLAFVMLLTIFGPWLSPKHFEVDNFRSTWNKLMLLLFSMLAYIYATVLLSSLYHGVDTGRWVLGGVCLAFALMGNFLGKVRKNFFIGVRTPWTLASDRVWNTTHRLAARTWMAGGLLGLLLTIFGLSVLSVSVLLLSALTPYVYSLVVYKHFERHGGI